MDTQSYLAGLTLVRLTIKTPCEQGGCTNAATHGYYHNVSGRLGRCYCQEHVPAEDQAEAARLTAKRS